MVKQATGNEKVFESFSHFPYFFSSETTGSANHFTQKSGICFLSWVRAAVNKQVGVILLVFL